MKILKKQNIKFELNTKVEKITKNDQGVIIETTNKDSKNKIEADVVLISVGRKPYTDKFRYYLRLNVVDKSGVLADVTSIFKNYGLSIESFIQKSNQEDKTAELVIITHEAEGSVLKDSLSKISTLDGVITKPVCLSIYS